MSYSRAVRGRVIEQRGNLASTGVFPRENDEKHLPHRDTAGPEEVPINCLAQSPFTKAKICVRWWCISLSLGSSFLERKNSVDTHSFSGSCWFLFVCFSKANTAKRDWSRLSQRKEAAWWVLMLWTLESSYKYLWGGWHIIIKPGSSYNRNTRSCNANEQRQELNHWVTLYSEIQQWRRQKVKTPKLPPSICPAIRL